MDLAASGGRKRPIWRRVRCRPPGGISWPYKPPQTVDFNAHLSPPPICPKNLQNLANWDFRFFGKSRFRFNCLRKTQTLLGAPKLGCQSMDLAVFGDRKRPIWRRVRSRPAGGISWPYNPPQTVDFNAHLSPPPICPKNLQNLANWDFRFSGKSGFC